MSPERKRAGGRPRRVRPGARMMIVIDADLRDRLRQAAEHEGRTMSAMVARALTHYLRLKVRP